VPGSGPPPADRPESDAHRPGPRVADPSGPDARRSEPRGSDVHRSDPQQPGAQWAGAVPRS
jgi:hypothetical protein